MPWGKRCSIFELVYDLCEIKFDVILYIVKNHSLYIRPTGISLEDTLGVRAGSKIKLYTILSPVGPYYPKGFKPVSILCSSGFARSWYNGSGDKKLGSNYGPTVKPQKDGNQIGYDQILWLVEDYISEVGVMNVFIYWYNEEGEKELVTNPLDGTILPGITRMSVLELVKYWKEFKVTERKVHIEELVKAVKEERIIEMFG